MINYQTKLKNILFCTLLLSQTFLGMSQENIGTIAKQKILETCIISFKFRMTSINDIKHPQNKKNNIMLLQVGKKMSKFSDIKLLEIDSLLEKYSKKETNFSEIFGKSMSIGKGGLTFSIFKNYPNSKITVTDKIPFAGVFKYVENHDKILWNIQNGELDICGYKCQKATTTFRGRNYTAWYTKKIPISDGPWKFWGLPGMVLKISDDKEHYSFDCISIEKPRSISGIYILEKGYINTNRKRFNNALKEFNENPGASIQASGMVKNGLPEKIKSRPYNPIELSE